MGVDAGGTRTRVLVADLAGRVRGRADGAGANPVTGGLDKSLQVLRTAMAIALGDRDPATVGYVVLGLAGDTLARQPDPARLLSAMLRDAGLRCPYAVVGDAVVAFAAGTAEPDGRLLISGTGSVAVRIRQHRIVDTAGGYGWQLGDEGSGYWLGREAVRVAVDALRGRARAPHLTQLVCKAILGTPEPSDPGPAGAEQLLTALYAEPAHRLSSLAPFVVEASNAGDPDGSNILDRAAQHLSDTLQQLGPDEPAAPVVLAGTCLAADILGRRTADLILAQAPVARLLRAEDHAAGAAWLAAGHLLGDRTRLAAVHRALTTPVNSA
jgi:N-acetylglucosamine kinase-like BadF-type ATPase